MFTINDYSVTIGKDNCIITELRVDRLTCTPPVQQPEIGEEYYIYNEYPIPQVEVRKKSRRCNANCYLFLSEISVIIFYKYTALCPDAPQQPS